MSGRILIAEDDRLIASFIEKGLRASGYATHLVANGDEAERMVVADSFDLLILDMALPGLSGFQVLQQLRSRGVNVPVIVLTGRPELKDVVAFLDVGADDYMTKPFRFDELLARVRARLRDHGTDEAASLTVGKVHLDLRTRRARTASGEIDLTAREFSLLELFMRHPGQVLSREQILSHVWGYFFDPGSNLVNVYVGALRKKLGNGVIETVRGAGYRMLG